MAITGRLLDREQIYADLGVPELWRFDGRKLKVRVLHRGRYRTSSTSPTFPTLPLPRVEQFVAAGQTTDETTWAKSVRKWVRQNLVKRA